MNKKPSYFKRPVEPWECGFAAIMLVGMFVVGLINEQNVMKWLAATFLASPALALVVGKKNSK